MRAPTDRSRLVLLLTPTGRDALLAGQALEAAGIQCEPCPDVARLVEGLAAGAGAAVVAEEALRTEGVELVLAALRAQPPWSDFPIILLGDPDSGGRRDARLLEQANVTLLERPFRMRTLLAAAASALRARDRQYEAQRAIHDRDMFLAMLGHELRNPLTAIRFALAGLEPAQRTRAMQVIERQADRLGRLVDDLLDVSRVTSRKVQLRREPLDLRALLQGSVDAVAPAAADAGLGLAFAAGEGALDIDADAVRLEQVFSNLLSNAIKFTPPGGRIDVRADRLGPNAVVAVRDSGIGIPADALTRVFQPFAQLEAGLDRARGGLGLGLTLAKGLVELHGGAIQASSAGPGLGTEVRVVLPLAARPAPRPTVAMTLRSPRRRIVLVEDNDDLREGFQALLEAEGHEVRAERDGAGGLKAIVEGSPDVAFVDLGLPVMDGYAVAREARARLGRAVRLVAVSGYGQAEDKRRALAAGFDEHLTKPVDPRTLEALLRDVGLERLEPRAA